MKLQIIFATGNADKVREIREILADPDITVQTMKEAGIAASPEENGETFTDNARIKARAVARLLVLHPECVQDPAVPVVIMSDDSGLCIDALGGAPGIHSARFMGHDTSYTVKMNALLARLKDVPDEKRTARFTCAVAAILPKSPFTGGPDGWEELTAATSMEGVIAHSIRGAHGFGYDPFFYLPELRKTSAELTDREKNAISHRGKAIRKIMQQISERL